MMMTSPRFVILLIFGFCGACIHALDIGFQVQNDNAFFKNCSRDCESMFCDSAPFLKYGKYCGLMYSGCPGEQPCDQLDICCMNHDLCITKLGNAYLSLKCNEELLKCVEEYRRSGASPFKGNTCNVNDVVDVINSTMRAAILAGKIWGTP